MNVSETLNAAADLIEDKGWCQGVPEDGEGRVCAVGAIRRVCEGKQDDYFASRVAVKTQMAVEKHVGTFVSRWNDEPGRTKDEVVQTFRDLAAIHRPEE